MDESRVAFAEAEASRGRSSHCRLGRSRVLVWSGPLLFVFFLVFVVGPGQRERVIAAIHQNAHADMGSPVYNETLGFQKVFAIGLPGRTDKRDAMTLAAAYSGINIEWADGVRFDDMDAKAIPKAFDDMPTHITGGAKQAIIGSWRAHLNVMSRIVNDRIQTALILEDDVDWDISLKAQLEEFARGTSTLQQNTPGDSPRNSTYGNNWDTLWLGHCRLAPSSATQEMYFISNDTTVPPVPFRTSTWMQRPPPDEIRSNSTRIITKAAAGGCTFGYAVTWQAAQKIIASLSLTGEGIIYDISVGHMCSGLNIAPFTCYGIYPPLMASHRFAGRANRDSDIRTKFNRLHGEQTFDIVYSVIMNIGRLLSGAGNALSQWPADTIPQRGVHESYAAQVSRECRTVNVVMPPEEEEATDLDLDTLDAERLDLMGITNLDDGDAV